MDKNYYNFTDYHLEPGGLSKLDFIVNFIQKRFNIKKIAILDIGCGSGNIALPLAYLGYQVTAIDGDREAIDLVKKRNKFPNLFLANVKFEDYHCDSGFRIRDSGQTNNESRITKFDLIIMSEFLEHLNDPEKVLLKTKNLLTEDGYIIVTVPNGRSVEEFLRRFLLSSKLLVKIKRYFKRKLIKREIQTPAQSPHLHFWNYRQIEKLLNEAGLKIEQALVYASFAKEFFYIIGRIFIKRGGFIFKIFNKTDNFLASHIPIRFGSSWLMVLKKDD